jgi:hypothetical protein
MATNGAFANANRNLVRVHGRGVGHPPNPGGYDIAAGGGGHTYMTIVGFPGGNSYNIYSQTTRNDTIAEWKQIF